MLEIHKEPTARRPWGLGQVLGEERLGCITWQWWLLGRSPSSGHSAERGEEEGGHGSGAETRGRWGATLTLAEERQMAKGSPEHRWLILLTFLQRVLKVCPWLKLNITAQLGSQDHLDSVSWAKQTAFNFDVSPVKCFLTPTSVTPLGISILSTTPQSQFFL